MPWKLIAYLAVLTLVVLFAGFNLTNLTDISFGFYTLTKVPVFLSLFISFLFGTFLTLPFAFRKRNAKGTPPISREMKQDAENKPAGELPAAPEQLPDDPKKRRKKK